MITYINIVNVFINIALGEFVLLNKNFVRPAFDFRSSKSFIINKQDQWQ
jgi:hypothetical protein